MTKQNFQHCYSSLQCSHDPSESILICCSGNIYS